MRAEVLLVIVSGSFVICFWIWFLFFRTPHTDSEQEIVQGMAMSEILAACNAAYTDKTVSGYFRREDIKENKTPPENSVVLYASVLEVSRNNIFCLWDGINPARVTRR